jgi:hypothetical protein
VRVRRSVGDVLRVQIKMEIVNIYRDRLPLSLHHMEQLWHGRVHHKFVNVNVESE